MSSYVNANVLSLFFITATLVPTNQETIVEVRPPKEKKTSKKSSDEESDSTKEEKSPTEDKIIKEVPPKKTLGTQGMVASLLTTMYTLLLISTMTLGLFESYKRFKNPPEIIVRNHHEFPNDGYKPTPTGSRANEAKDDIKTKATVAAMNKRGRKVNPTTKIRLAGQKVYPTHISKARNDFLDKKAEEKAITDVCEKFKKHGDLLLKTKAAQTLLSEAIERNAEGYIEEYIIEGLTDLVNSAKAAEDIAKVELEVARNKRKLLRSSHSRTPKKTFRDFLKRLWPF